MTERCVNLNAAEARAWANGASVLIRPAANEFLPFEGIATRWRVGDILVLRETWDIADINEQEVIIRYWCGGPGFHTTLPTPPGWRPLLANYEWIRSPATMPKALARHRYPVTSVRVCRMAEVSLTELSNASGHTSLPWVSAPFEWVNVTMLDRSGS